MRRLPRLAVASLLAVAARLERIWELGLGLGLVRVHSGTQAGGVEVWCGAGSVWRRGYGDSRAVAWGGAALAPALKLKPGAFGFMAAVSLTRRGLQNLR